MRLALALIAWAGVASAQTVVEVKPDLPPGYPPKMGDVAVILGTQPLAYATYDYSVGAFDASAWAGVQNDHAILHLRALPDGKPDAERMVLDITADFGAALTKGTAPGPVEVVIYRGRNHERARLVSSGDSTHLTVTALEGPRDGAYGHIKGSVDAWLCPVKWFSQSCQRFDGNFDTELQYDGAVPVK